MDQVFKQDIGFEYNSFRKKGKKAFKILNVADIITGMKTEDKLFHYSSGTSDMC